MFGEHGAALLLQGLARLALILLDFIAAAVCAIHVRKSRWIWAIFAGFLVEGMVGTFNQIAMVLLANGTLRPQVYSTLVFLVGSVPSLLGRAVIVAGIAGLLANMSGESR